MNTKTDEGLYEKARKLFISKASIDEFMAATPAESTPSTACSTRNWRTGTREARQAPAAPVPRRQGSRRHTTSRTSGSPTATCSMSSRAPVSSARAGLRILRQDRARKDTSRDRAGHEGDRHGAGRGSTRPPSRPPAG